LNAIAIRKQGSYFAIKFQFLRLAINVALAANGLKKCPKK
jgi:hypothetical protein